MNSLETTEICKYTRFINNPRRVDMTLKSISQSFQICGMFQSKLSTLDHSIDLLK